jgi:hypothetical protein
MIDDASVLVLVLVVVVVVVVVDALNAVPIGMTRGGLCLNETKMT